MTDLPPAALAAAENFLPLSVVNDGETIKLSDRNGNSVASMMFVSLRGRHDPDAISALAKLLVEAVNARHTSAPAPEGEVEARQQMSDTKTPAPDVAREDDGGRPLPFDRDQLGRFVREAWVRWAQTQPNPKPSWLVSYDALDEPDKEADRQIGEAIARWTLIGDAARAALAAGAAPEAGFVLVPKGWKLVPQWPTEEQISNVKATAASCHMDRCKTPEVCAYHAAIEVAPAPPAAAEEIVQLLDECADVPSFKAGVAEIIARLDRGAMRPRDIIALHATDPEAAFTAAMTRIERLEGFLRSDDTSLETKERIYAQARRDLAREAAATDGEIEAAIEAVEAAVKLAPLEYVSPNGNHVYEPANSKRRLKEAARLLRSLPALRAENERLTALLERNRE
jgi:hypothetical protein